LLVKQSPDGRWEKKGKINRKVWRKENTACKETQVWDINQLKKCKEKGSRQIDFKTQTSNFIRGEKCKKCAVC